MLIYLLLLYGVITVFRIGQRAHNKAALEALLVTLCDGLLGEVLNAEIDALCALSMKENVFDVRSRLQQIAERLDKLVFF